MTRLLRGAYMLAAFAILLHADFEPSRWHYRRSLIAPNGALSTANALGILNIDRGIYVHSQADLTGLRIISPQGEVPFVLERMSGTTRHAEVSSGALNRTLDQGVNAAGDLELTIDVGNGDVGAGRKHNGIRLATAKTNFRQRVSISASADRVNWALLRDDGYIFDFTQDRRHVFVAEVNYPVSTRRYLRVTVHGWKDPQAVSGVSVTLEESVPAIRDVMATLKAPQPQQDLNSRSDLFTWDLGAAGIPHDRIELAITTPAFERAAIIEASDDAKQWFVLGQGALLRLEKNQAVALDFRESSARYLRLRIYNQDDRPLNLTAVTLSIVRTRLKFKTAAATSYWLYYGNEDARVPSYDLGNLLAREAPLPEVPFTAGPEEPNPEFREKPAPLKPWTERHPAILYVTLVLAVVGMGIVTIRFLSKVKLESS